MSALGSLTAVLALAAAGCAADLPLPTAPQLAWQKGEIMALIHFNMATFFHDGDPGCDATNWQGCDPSGSGCKSSDPNSFAPSALNISQWVDAMEAVGINEAVLTAKHGCGFYLWPPTNVTLPDGTPYPYHVNETLYGNVLAEFAAATSARGIGHGFYYSLTNNFFLNVASHSVRPPSTLLPGQVNVTQQQFEDIAFASVAELWSNFGNLTEIWFDGGYTGDMQARLEALLRAKQPNAVAFGGVGISANPVRWCGTEGGTPPGLPDIWSTDCGAGSGPGCTPDSPGADWNPSGVDFTLQQGDHWFWTPGDGIHDLATLVDVYHNSVGANGRLELDFAIDRTGQLHPAHMAAYQAFGAWIRTCYGAPVAAAAPAAGALTVLLPIPGGVAAVDRVSIAEDQSFGQLITGWTVEAQDVANASAWLPFAAGHAIGNRRIALAPAPVSTPALRLTVTALAAAAITTHLASFAAFAPAPCALPSSRARLGYGGRCLVSNGTGFPCPGGAGNACPVFLGPCDAPTAVWDVASGVLTNVFWSLPGEPAQVNIDCDAVAPRTVAKLLRYGGGAGNPIAFDSGQLVYTAGAASMCLNGGQGVPTPPCGGEQYAIDQIQLDDCASADTRGWTLTPVP